MYNSTAGLPTCHILELLFLNQLLFDLFFSWSQGLSELMVRDLRKRMASRGLKLQPGAVEKRDLVDALRSHHSAAQTHCVICFEDFCGDDALQAALHRKTETRAQSLHVAWLRWRAAAAAAALQWQRPSDNEPCDAHVSRRFLANHAVVTTEDSFCEMFRVPGTSRTEVPSEKGFLEILVEEEANRSRSAGGGDTCDCGASRDEGCSGNGDGDGINEACMVRVLPCHHLFHIECIDRWAFAATGPLPNTPLVQRNAACPLCNALL